MATVTRQTEQLTYPICTGIAYCPNLRFPMTTYFTIDPQNDFELSHRYICASVFSACSFLVNESKEALDKTHPGSLCHAAISVFDSLLL